MLSLLLNKILNFFESLQESDLESYISSRHPSNAAEIDHIIREYCYRNKSGWL